MNYLCKYLHSGAVHAEWFGAELSGLCYQRYVVESRPPLLCVCVASVCNLWDMKRVKSVCVCVCVCVCVWWVFMYVCKSVFLWVHHNTTEIHRNKSKQTMTGWCTIFVHWLQFQINLHAIIFNSLSVYLSTSSFTYERNNEYRAEFKWYYGESSWFL